MVADFLLIGRTRSHTSEMLVPNTLAYVILHVVWAIIQMVCLAFLKAMQCIRLVRLPLELYFREGVPMFAFIFMVEGM